MLAVLLAVVVVRVAVVRMVVRVPALALSLGGRVVQGRPRATVRVHHAALASRRRYAAASVPDRMVLAAQRAALVESERTRRVALTACRGWLACIALFLLSVAAWILWVAWPEGTSQTVTRNGFDIRFIPDTDTAIAPAALGAAAGVVIAALVMVWRDRTRLMAPYRPPLLESAQALAACRDAEGSLPRIEDALLALRRALVTYARHGHATHREREGELVAHAQVVGRALHDAGRAVWRQPPAGLPELVRLLGTVHDRAHERGWLALLDDPDLPGPPPDPPSGTPHSPGGLPASGTTNWPGRWSAPLQHTAVLLPAVAAVGALVFSSITVRQANDNLRVTEHDSVSSRFSTAVGQLDSRSLDVRLGGLFTLERIIEDSPRDHTTVLQLWCAYVRGHAREGGQQAPEDAETAMRLLGDHWKMADGRFTACELSGTHLNGMVLGEKDYQEADFTGLDLQGVDLTAATLRVTDFTNADLQHAVLTGADLYEAILRHADLRNADLSVAGLRRANLAGADLRGAELEAADLREALYSSNTKWPRGYRPPSSAQLIED
ncbi:pentapeptide repeat-containing protein [Streptomyces sp. NPDC002935]|uniref:pentapeptide repeat-containing protein n=1 Tax=Streptomyces sp. NPDC002935 TaxID=3154545 RepID=UPI0033AD988E